ncbi:DNA primase [Roseibium algicola]|uniref:DNA primase n=1 Tax=Roseibium algicola TaxID=2857014 RepID=A0ABN4WXS3_9HYPH|nr:toprim domain-containing protein [Roseibium aggregatum]AQQ03931.1 DNA primase [Roseibium aggregatum]
MSRADASELAARLAREAEAVCRHYLPAGRRSGRYWLVGDVQGSPGRSMFVRLKGPDRGKGVAGKWTDAATGEHGDLLDVIRERCGLTDFRDVAEEARRFLNLPRPEPEEQPRLPQVSPVPSGSAAAARRLFAMSQPINGTLVETYMCNRGITALHETASLRFHPACYYRPEGGGATRQLPAMVAAVTDLGGRQTGAHRTWLAVDGSGKAVVETPRRAMGDLLGHGVRFGVAQDVLAAGEGIETVLSARSAGVELPVLAALSAAHLAAIQFPKGLRRLYVLCDRDPAGEGAWEVLLARAAEAGIEALVLTSRLGDFNDDLRCDGIDALRERLRLQLHPDDVARFLAA